MTESYGDSLWWKRAQCTALSGDAHEMAEAARSFTSPRHEEAAAAFPELWGELTPAGQDLFMAGLLAQTDPAERVATAHSWLVKQALRSNPYYHQGLAEAAAGGRTVVVIDPNGEEPEPDPEKEDIIRAKWAMEGATTLQEAAALLRQRADELEALYQQGWRLTEPVTDDYGFIERTAEEASDATH